MSKKKKPPEQGRTKEVFACCKTANRRVKKFGFTGGTICCVHILRSWKNKKSYELFLGPRIVLPNTCRPGWCETCDEERKDAGGFTNIPFSIKMRRNRMICSSCHDAISKSAENVFVTVELFGKKEPDQ